MKLIHLLLREISHRKLTFIAGVLAVAIAAGCGAGAILLLEGFDRETENILEKKQQVSRRKWAEFKDEMRKDMLDLGFNLMILPEDYNVSNPTPEEDMPEEYAKKLASAGFVEINHILPFLQQKYFWDEHKRWITLVGTTGEVYIKNPQWQTPMLQKVNQGRAVLGYAIAEGLDLSVGDKITLGGREFEITRCLDRRGPHEDENIFIPMRSAQEILDKDGRITGMLAVNCMCIFTKGEEDIRHFTEVLMGVREKIKDFLPGTKVLEHNTKLLARARVRSKAARQADVDLAQMKRLRADLRSKRATYSAVLIPLVILVAAFGLGMMMWENVSRRRMEIGILRALGVGGGKIQTLFLGKAAIIGLVGAIIGYAAARVGLTMHSGLIGWSMRGFDSMLLGICVFGAAALAVAASWIPAQLAAATDPALVLLEEGA